MSQPRSLEPDLESTKTRLESLDKAHLWHPFTQMQGWQRSQPLIIERAEGCYLYDLEGRRYLDGVSSLWVTTHGHRTPELDAAIRHQLDRVAHTTLLGLTHAPAIELAAKLVQLAPPGLTRVFYSDAGSTAVEVALKIAFQYWRQRPDPRPRKTKFVHLRESYHGDTVGAVSVGGIELFHEIYRPLLFEALTAPEPHCYRCPLKLERPTCGMACAEELGRVLADQADDIAAVIIEPIMMGAAGMLAQPEGYVRRVRELCTQHDVLLICDEVATGFGRTGWMFACEAEGIAPDLLCIAKGLTGGYLPLAATLATETIYAAFLGEAGDFKTFFHGHTYTGNPLACAAALANLALFEQNNTLQHVRAIANYLAEQMDRLRPLRLVGDIRQRGLMVGIELVADRATRTPFPPEQLVGYHVTNRCRDYGVLLRPLGNVIVLMPPLAVSTAQIDELIDALQTVLTEIEPELLT
ncbi:adenosylmethionine--8-amino-7-oxononanoate transaminase [Chloracidobacterium validum]|uniref:Adenosylmethionine-8-amino-7-oxononanoate aminotransferase n=2 Tax=Chloracidobacterium validum TaxID=2821543 RepID=A0ABX8BER1_9BACT|nr:adenosylmethionine--8-amino-7-oxononanoate transaminase [Chloracidobacterium validum]